MEETSRVTRLLREFLERKTPPEAGSRLGLEFARREIAAELRTQGKPPTRDYVFLSFLLGRKPQLRDLEAPAWLRHLLYPNGLPVLRLRRVFWLALGLLAGGVFFSGAELLAPSPGWRKIRSPPTRDEKPVNNLSARALEIAAAHLGQPADAGFASRSFDQAVAFAALRGVAKPGLARPGMVFTPKSAATTASLVERVAESGLIMIEPFEGRLRRTFRTTDELVGSFNEITEQERHTKVNPTDGLTYVWIPPGTFKMGCSPGDSECEANEKPAHRVTITKGFWIGQTEVTQAAYERVTKGNQSYFKGASLPVETISWDEAGAYCKAVGMRLPTEAEWEYAARGGNQAAPYGALDAVAWYSGNSGSTTHEVGQKQANGYGLYDTLGNVWEWVADWFDEKYYASSPANDPQGPSSGQYRVLRGGAFVYVSRIARVSYRLRYEPSSVMVTVGVRCAGD
jgi:formylglycine-generating enzyme required for sulfatase activity